MEVDRILPADFDGTFKFTNYSEEDFIGKWGSKEYRFPANTTSPMIIPQHSPIEIQNIRKKFAKDLAEREYGKSSDFLKFVKYERNDDGTPRLNSFHGARTYSINELAPFIQKALEPLKIARAEVKDAPIVPVEDKISRDEAGALNSFAVEQGMDLTEAKKSLRRKAIS